MRLIDADKVNETIDRFIGYLDEDMILRIKIAIKKDVPTLERPSGEWNILQKDDNGIHEIECPFCKYSKGGRFASVGITFHKLPPFCEACGADMREGKMK